MSNSEGGNGQQAKAFAEMRAEMERMKIENALLKELDQENARKLKEKEEQAEQDRIENARKLKELDEENASKLKERDDQIAALKDKNEQQSRQLVRMKEAQEKAHAELAESMKKVKEQEEEIQNAERKDAASRVVRETIGEVLAKRPKLVETLAKPTFKMPQHGEKKSKFSSHGSTVTAPPNYIPAIKLLPAAPGKSWNDFWTKDKYDLFQHKKTGLLHFKQPEGDGEPMLRKWPMDVFKKHLASAEQATIDGGKLWPELLVRRVNELTGQMLSEGKYDHLEDGGVDLIGEPDVEHALSITIYFLLTWVFKLDFLKNRNVALNVNPGPLDNNNKPEYRAQRKIDQAIQMVRTVHEHKRTMLFIVCETKVDWKFPSTLDECQPAEDANKRHNLVEFYMNSETGHTLHVARRNALVQIRMYLAYYHRKFGILTTLNTWTFVRLDSEGVMWVSDTYHADQVVDEEEWSATEVLLRFIVAGLGESTAGKRPFDTMETRPDSVKEYFLDRGVTDKDASFDP